MFKLAIKVCFENYFVLIHVIFLLLGSTKSVYFFLRHPVLYNANLHQEEYCFSSFHKPFYMVDLLALE